MADTNYTFKDASGNTKTHDARSEGTNSELRAVICIGDPATNANVASVDASNGLAVDVKALPTLPAGTNNIGRVDINNISAGTQTNDVKITLDGEAVLLAAGTNNIGRIDVNDISAGTQTNDVKITLDGEAVILGAGTSNIGRVDINDISAGTQTNDVKVTLDGENVALAAGTNTIGNVKITDGTETVSVNASNQLEVAVGNTINVTGDVAHDSADSGNPVKIGGVARTSNPTAVADGDRVNAAFDDIGRQVVVLNQVRDLTTHGTATISTTSETTILSAAGAGVYLDLTAITIANTSATDVRVDIRDASSGTVRLSFLAPAGQTVGAVFQVPVTQAAANNAWTAQLSSAVTDVRVFMQAVKNV